ncbi:ELWxxDGT repeat protein, partial [Azonexus sp.]|uniref:ELWxxDGT repeat protein n=1 Tax=Azonexus sp. TaxID=1872668 RepID=UPI0027B8BB75
MNQNTSRTHSLILIDSQLPDLATLQAGLPGDAEVHLLSPLQDGLTQLSEILDGRSDIASLHLITHGAPGQLFIGNSSVDREILRNSRAEMEAISNAMAEDGELLIYGCEVAAGREGRLFVDALMAMTGLKVAAATHKVGAAELGGDWDLNVGMPVTRTLQVVGWGHVLADGAAPVYFSATVETGKIQLTFDEALASALPAVGAFTVKVNGVTRTVTDVTLNTDTQKIDLTIDGAALDPDDYVTIDYTAPAPAPEDTNAAIQDVTGNDAASIAETHVINRVVVVSTAQTSTRYSTDSNPVAAENSTILVTSSGSLIVATDSNANTADAIQAEQLNLGIQVGASVEAVDYAVEIDNKDLGGSGSALANKVINYGTLSAGSDTGAALKTLNGKTTLVNAGAITGNVILSADADDVVSVLRTGSVAGYFDAGAGTGDDDVLELHSSDTSLSDNEVNSTSVGSVTAEAWVFDLSTVGASGKYRNFEQLWTYDTDVTLIGAGNVGVTMDISSGGTLKVGDTLVSGTVTAGVGSLQTKDLTLEYSGTEDSELVFDLNGGSTAGTHYDQISVTGALTAGGALTLRLGSGFTANLNDKFTLIANDSTDTVTGTFTGLAEGAEITSGAYKFTISYAGGIDTNDVELTVSAVPAALSSTADSLTINEDTVTTFTANDFGTLTGTLHTVKITTLATAGSLQYKTGDTTWGSVSTNQTFTKAQIDAGELRFTPAEHKNGNTYATIGFQVSGDGSTFSTAYDLTVNITPVQDAPAINPLALHAIFRATTSLGMEPYITDGTTAGTVLLKDLPGGSNGGLSDDNYYKPPYFASLGSKVVFGGNDPAFSYQRGLYVTDGTANGTIVLTAATGERIEHPTEMIRLGDKIIFQASSTLGGRELWVTDGASAGTTRIKDINPSGNAFEISSSSPANPFAVIGNKAYFTANDGTNGAELWVTDGTEAGTQMVKDVYTGATDSSIRFLKAVGDKVYFAAKSAASGAYWEPWVSDGTANGTIQLKAGSASFSVSDNSGLSPQFVPVGDKVLFLAFQAGSGNELWVTDGTTVGTQLLKEIYSGSIGSTPDIYSLGTKGLIFADGGSGRALWVTDGTANGTTQLLASTTVSPWSTGELGKFAIVVNGKLYFQASNAAAGRELWVSDGTVEGTKLIKDIMPGTEGSFPSVFTAFGDGIIFAASGAGYTGDQEPWFSDGTEAGTYRIADVRPGPGSPSHLLADSYPSFFTTFYKAVAEARGNNLTAIAEDVVDGSNAGNTAASLVQDYLITDPDLTTAPKAIAVSAVDSTNGTWQYKVGGGSWTAFDFTTNSGKVLLLDSTDGLRFVPNENYNGTVTSGITFHAWDKTSGNAGDYLTVSGNTGTDKTLSTLTAKSGITVTPTNDAPTGVPTFTGSLVVGKTLTASSTNVADVDGLGSFSYQWQVSDNGQNSWSDIPSATQSTYTIGASYGGKDIRVKVSYTDQGGTSEAVYSALSTIGTPPTFTAFAAAVDSGNEDEEIELTYNELLAHGNESGTTTKFVVKAVSSGTLKIGADAATATAWHATNNSVIDSTKNAYWTPAGNANGNGVSAFTVVAADADDGESATPVAVTVNLTAVNDDPAISSSPVTSVTQGAVYSYTLGATDADGDVLTWAVKQGETLPSWLKVEKAPQTEPTMISITNMSYGEYAEVAESASHIFVVDSGAHRILKISKADNSTSYISTGASTFPLGLAYDNDGSLYYSQVMGTTGIYKIGVNGGASTLIKAGSEVLHNLAYNNGYLYYQGNTSGSIVKLLADGTGTPEVIQAVPTPSSGFGNEQTEVYSSGQYLYFGVSSDGTARNNIMRYDTTNSVKTMLLNNASADFVRDIAVDQAGNVYFTIGSTLPSVLNKVNSDGTYAATSISAMSGFNFDTSGTLWTVPYGFRVNKYQGVDQLTGTPGASDIGVHEVKIQVSDGNGGVTTQTFTINVAPGAPASPDLDAASDLGSSSTDNITSDTTPTFTGTAAANATVTLYDTNGTTELGTATADQSGNWSITSSTLSAGAHAIQAKQTVGGVVSAISTGLSVTIDTAAPSNTVSGIALSADTGSSTSDFNSTTAAQTITATLSGALGAGEEVYGSLDDGATWTNITDKVSGTALSWDDITLSGSSTIKLEVRDTAGNAGTTLSQAYVLDTTAPTVTNANAAYGTHNNTLKLIGTNFDTLLSASEDATTDIKVRLDWSKLSWDINGDDGTTADVSFALSDISSAKVTNGTTLAIVLADAKATSLESMSGFGAVGEADTLDVTAGFARDAAGNAASTDAAANLALGITTSNVTLNVGNPFTADTTDSTPVTIIAPDGVNITNASNSTVSGLPKNVKMPLGQFGFTLEGVEVGGTATLSMTADKDFKQFTYFKKSVLTGKWVNITEGVTINNDGTATVKFSLKDGGEFDADRTVNGVIVDPGGVGANALLPMLLENTAEVGNVSLLNENAATGTLSYAITGGVDQDKFTINSSTGLLSFSQAPDYEHPLDAGDTAGNNTYAVQVTVTGSTSGTEVQNLIVTVLNVAEDGDNANTAPVIIGLRAEAQEITAGTAAALDDIRVADTNNNPMTVTLTATNGTIGGLTDADPNTPGIQLSGTAAQINTALANATFTASAAGAAGVSLSVVDSSVSTGTPITTTAFYSMTAAAAPSSGGGGSTPAPGPTPAPAPGTVTTVDGATVTTSTTTTTDGRVLEVVTVTPVSDNRQESTGDAGRADIALYYSDSAQGVPATTASLPTGVGLTSTGARTPADNTEALANLITLVNQTAGTTENNRPDMVSGGESFLARLEQQADKGPLIVNSIKLTAAPGQTSAPDKPITITGSTGRVAQGSGNGNGGAPVEAIVIDTRDLPPGTVLELKDIEFAVIIGDNVTIRGGEGANIVFAGSGPQNIVLGADDDELSGGDGNDVIGSREGNDLINGDAGNDWLVGGVGNDTLNGGEGNDLLHGGASDAGTYRFSLNEAGKVRLDWTATHADMAVVANGVIDGQWWNGNGQLSLSDARFAFVGADGGLLQDVAALYQAVIKQLPSVADLNTWAAAGKSSSQLAQLAFEAYQSQQGPGAQALEVQVAQLIQHVWGGTADPALVQAGVTHLNQGGSWGEALLYLARHTNNTQA